VQASRAPTDGAGGGITHADTVHSLKTHAACFADCNDHVTGLLYGRERHGLCGCCEGQRNRKGTSDQSDHRVLPSIVQEWPNRARNLAGGLIWIKKGRLRSGSLPVELPTRFEQVIKLKTANVLAHVPTSVLARADEVIE
jgi:hypothetical protein